MGPWSSGTAFAQERVRRNVEIEWEPVPDATRYEIQIVRKGDSIREPLSFVTKKSIWQATVKPGTYSMQIRSYDNRDVPGSWTPATELIVKLPAIIPIEPAANAKLQAPQELYPMNFRWEPIPGAVKYRLDLTSNTTNWTKTIDVAEPSASVEVPAGENYQWNVRAIDSSSELGESNSDPYLFSIQGAPLSQPDIEKPITKFVRELSWSRPKFSQTFSYELSHYQRKTKKWIIVDRQTDFAKTTLSVDISRPSGIYRLTVSAHATRHLPSAPSQLVFGFRGGFRSPAALEIAELRDSIYKPTSFYAIASYLLTQVRYEGTVYEDNSGPSFEALGGTGRIGLGYQPPSSDWGGFGIVDLSGFIIEKKNYTFASAEAHVSRRFTFGRGGVILAGIGPFFKELPIIRGSETIGFRGTGTVSNLGAHGGFTYWLPLSQRVGLQLNARSYYSLSGSTRDGQKVLSGFSYQYGLLGTYRLKNDWMGYAGYAHRTDETRYEADAGASGGFADPGDVNHIVIRGDYLNLILEWSF